MHWKVKAVLQNAISFLPGFLSYRTYYRVQRLFGGLRCTNPEQHLAAGIHIVDYSDHALVRGAP